MLTAILILLALTLLILVWFIVQSQKRTADPAVSLLQQEVQSLRGQLSDAMIKSQDAVNHQLGHVMQQVNAQLGQVTSQVNTRLSDVTQQLQKSTGDLNTRLDNAAKVVSEVSKGLGGLSEATKKVFDVGKDIASQQEILRSPKLRGGLGELFLGDLLAQMFPPAPYSLQYRFKSNEAVDAVIRLGHHLTRLAPQDARTRSVVEAMRADEARHRQTAVTLGAAELPAPAKAAMRALAKAMTTIAFRV